VAGSFEHGNLPLSSLNGRGFIDQLSDYSVDEGLCSVQLVIYKHYIFFRGSTVFLSAV
jgi:hypothetical protein